MNAAQTLIDENVKDRCRRRVVSTKITTEKIAELAEVDSNKISNFTLNKEGTKVATLTYTDGKKVCTYNPANKSSNSDGAYDVSKGK